MLGGGPGWIVGLFMKLRGWSKRVLGWVDEGFRFLSEGRVWLLAGGVS